MTKMKSDGWDGDENTEHVQWTFAGALFYSIIVITTIGSLTSVQTSRLLYIFYINLKLNY